MSVERLVSSPCCNPEFGVEEALDAYGKLGFRKFEVFTGWAGASFDWERDPGEYIALGQKYRMAFTSLHLPPVDEDPATIDRAVHATRFAKAIGADIVLFKATSRPVYIASAKTYLDAIEGLGATPVVQNHLGSPISTPADFDEVLSGIGDARMKTLLEVGHFHAAGVEWPEAHALLKGTFALVHIKDQIGAESTPFGQGEIDLPGLFRQLGADGYPGDIVVEMEVKDRENTLQYLGDAIKYLEKHCLGALP